MTGCDEYVTNLHISSSILPREEVNMQKPVIPVTTCH